MPQFRVRVVRVRRVVQDGFVTVEAEDKESAIEAAYEVDSDVLDWRTQDATTENFEPDAASIRLDGPPAPGDEARAEAAARSAGFTRCGDGEGYIFDEGEYGTWKSAVSWGTVYTTWGECCEAEDIEY